MKWEWLEAKACLGRHTQSASSRSDSSIAQPPRKVKGWQRGGVTATKMDKHSKGNFQTLLSWPRTENISRKYLAWSPELPSLSSYNKDPQEECNHGNTHTDCKLKCPHTNQHYISQTSFLSRHSIPSHSTCKWHTVLHTISVHNFHTIRVVYTLLVTY